MKNETKWFERIGVVYRAIDRTIVIISVMAIGVSLCFDISTEPYCCEILRKFYTYESDNIFALTLTVWTFITALIAYYLEKMNERCFGIRLSDVLELRNNKKVRVFLAKIGIFLIELLMLIVVSLINLPITLVTLTLLQVITMIYALLLVYCNTSEPMILDKVRQDFREIAKRTNDNLVHDKKLLYERILLVQVLCNIDYSNKEERDVLYNILCQRTIGRYILREMAILIVENAKNIEYACNFINRWIRSNMIPDEYKGELLFPFIQNGEDMDFRYCKDILQSLDRKSQRLAIVYCIARNKFLKKKIDQAYRSYYISVFEMMLSGTYSEEECQYEQELLRVFKEEEKHAGY